MTRRAAYTSVGYMSACMPQYRNNYCKHIILLRTRLRTCMVMDYIMYHYRKLLTAAHSLHRRQYISKLVVKAQIYMYILALLFATRIYAYSRYPTYYSNNRALPPFELKYLILMVYDPPTHWQLTCENLASFSIHQLLLTRISKALCIFFSLICSSGSAIAGLSPYFSRVKEA